MAIFHYLYDYLHCRLPIKRFWTNDLSDSNIDKALRNLRCEGDGKKPDLRTLTIEARLRGQFDWLLGMNGTRASSLKCGATTRIGRVMTPTLKLVVDRELAIQNYKPSYTYGVTGHFTGLEADLLADDGSGSILIEEKEEPIKEILKNLPPNSKGIVKEVEKKQETKKPAELYMLSTLQTAANRLFGYTANDTLAIVQNLYEKKIVTYPRTDISVVSSDMVGQFPRMIGACASDPTKDAIIDYIKKDKAAIKRVAKDLKYVDDEALKNGGHSAIVPTGNAPLWSSLSRDEQNIFSLIAERFLCIFLPPQITQKMTILLQVGKYCFRTTGRTVLDAGYTKFIGKNSSDTELPDLSKGEQLFLIDSGMRTYESTCPVRFTDGTLIQAMLHPAKYLNDKSLKVGLEGVQTHGQSGIGTEATRSSIIEKLVSLNYIVRTAGRGKAKQFTPSPFAISLIQNLGSMDVAAVDLTATWELKLKQVGEGEMSEQEFKKQMKDYIVGIVDQFKNNNKMQRLDQQGTQTREVVGKCPLCGSTVYEYGKCYACTSYTKEGNGCSFIISKEISGAKLSVANLKKLLDGKETSKLKMTSKRTGKEFESKLRLEEGKLAFVFEQNDPTDQGETLGKCPCCQDGSIVLRSGKYGPYYSCTQRCGLTINGVLCGKQVTKKVLKQLLEQGHTEAYELTKKDKSGTYKASFVLNKVTKKIELNFE